MWQIFLILLIICSSPEAQTVSILSWLWDKPEESTVLIADGVPLISIPYESMTDDEKFLQEASKFTDIQVSSPLEICQHKVILKIKTSCNEMSEEQLAKLSVNLLNCQSAVEGRKMFPCTDYMSLKQCTTDMDADMWNTYHLISNRARAVCYTSRSTQFRALTELTVNKLMQSAHSQIQALNSLKDSQDRLEEQTFEALHSLNKGNQALLEQQEHLRNAQASAHSLVSANLRELSSEKALIRAGHMQLVSMTEDIKHKLENANEHIKNQAVEYQQSHQEIMNNLTNIQKQAYMLLDKIENSTNRIIMQNKKAADQYEQTLKKLEQINATINFMWNVTNTMRAEIDDKLSWITSYIGNTGEQIHKIYRAFLHVVYLFVAMIISAFLQAPISTRALIICIIPLNLVTFWKHGSNASLDFVSITALILLITGVQCAISGIQYLIGLQMKRNLIKNQEEKMYSTNNHDKTSNVDKIQVPFYRQIFKKMLGLWYYLMCQSLYLKDKLKNCLLTAVHWTKRNVTPCEEMIRSCSYVPTRKMHDSILRSDMEPFNLSDDVSDSSESNHKAFHYNESENLIDNYLRQRIREQESVSSSVFDRFTSRSTSPSSRKSRCSAYTKSGKPCKFTAVKGYSFCHRHLSNLSIVEDDVSTSSH